ncbi:hypothetical protein PFLUV_G00173030 [Perca fluviatilis]|uniref:THAP domain-containing protein 1 n=1 Tax=Perca fluviatilis TaxID=8168 RepID=A0A6A5EU33_PERFL|nr:peroxynitrite isomerase THAP4-like [Perca fluviatilis]KAF1379144.1 hypothetical protein PFLUV_G00173030 [Perca fluviatilis]
MSCSAFGCKLRHNQGFSINFFRFPLRDRRRLKQWVMNVRRQNWTPTPASRLCSMHFEEDQFFIDNMCRRRLKDTAVPTIFNFPPHLRKKEPPARPTLNSSTGGVNDPLVSPADHYIVVVKQETAEEADVDVKQEPAEETDVDVKQEPAEETDVVDDVLPDYVVKLVIKADVNEAAAEDNADVDEVAADDMTEYTTSGDAKTVILDHDYFSKKQKEIRMCSDHMYGISESPVILKRRVNELCDKLVEARKKFKLKCQETRRMKSKLMSLKILTKGLQKKLNALQKKLNALQKCRPNGGMVQNVQEPLFLWVPCV